MSGTVAAMSTQSGAGGGGGGGGGSHLDTQSITTGSDGDSITQDRRRGYITGVIGFISDGTSDIYGGAVIKEMFWDENGGDGFDYAKVKVTGVVANSGWTTLTCGNGWVLLRTDAGFLASGDSYWVWSNLGALAGLSPFSGNPTCYFD